MRGSHLLPSQAACGPGEAIGRALSGEPALERRIGQATGGASRGVWKERGLKNSPDRRYSFKINYTYAPSMTTNQNVVIMAPERAKAVADRSQILAAQVDQLLKLPSKSETAGEGEQE